MKKYENEQKVEAFGSYVDPFRDRRKEGSTVPLHPLPIVKPTFKREYERNHAYFSWLGHSSVFLHMHTKNILIDPVFSTCVSPVSFVGPKRFSKVPITLEDLPIIDVVLLSHSHYDHLDKKTICLLDKNVRQYVVPKGIKDILRKWNIPQDKIIELSWYENASIDGLVITLVPSQHGSGRNPCKMNTSLWGGFILKDDMYTIYNSGDGGYAPHFKKIYELYGPIDLAIMECGQYNEKWHGVHMFPEEMVEACKDLHAKLVVPVHWGAYVLSDHAWNDPLRRFIRQAKEKEVSYKIMKMNDWIVL